MGFSQMTLDPDSFRVINHVYSNTGVSGTDISKGDTVHINFVTGTVDTGIYPVPRATWNDIAFRGIALHDCNQGGMISYLIWGEVTGWTSDDPNFYNGHSVHGDGASSGLYFDNTSTINKSVQGDKAPIGWLKRILTVGNNTNEYNHYSIVLDPMTCVW